MAKSDSKLAFVDRMRGLAILLVVMVHFSVNFEAETITRATAFGEYGVQLFFVASAFTLCLSFDRRGSERSPVLNFFVRRYFRIAPLYYLGIVGYGVLSILSGDTGARTLPNLLANVFFVHGFVPSAINGVVLGGWSIAVEMTFYAMFPWLFRLFSWIWIEFGKRGLAALICTALAISAAFQAGHWFFMGKLIANNDFYYFSFPIQFPAFAMGMAWYLAVYRDASISWAGWCDWLGLTCLLGFSMIVIAFDMTVFAAIAPALASASFVCLANILRRGTTAGGFLVEIGKVSYSIYLLHWLVVWSLTGRLMTMIGHTPYLEFSVYLPLLALNVAVLLLAGRMSKLLIEDPCNAVARRLITRREARLRGDHIDLPAGA